jgi:hypothetical protein
MGNEERVQQLDATLDSLEAILFGDVHSRSRDEMERRASELVQQREALLPFIAGPRWLSIGSHNNTAEVRVSAEVFNRARAVLGRMGESRPVIDSEDPVQRL